MFRLDNKSRKSIYEQIVDGFKEMIVRGELLPGDRLPSVRELSAQLTVNPNTIQKAYAALESQDWIYTVSGKGCYVGDDIRKTDEKQLEALYEKIGVLLSELLYLGVPEEDAKKKMIKMIEERRSRI